MKVDVRAARASEQLQPKPKSWSATVLKCLIAILLVPVQSKGIGNFQFKFLSCRFLLATVIWTLVPLALLTYSYYYSLLDGKNQEQVSANFVSLHVHNVYSVVAGLNIMLLPFCMAFLVSKVNLPDECLRMPAKYAQVFVIYLLMIIQLITFYGTHFNIDLEMFYKTFFAVITLMFLAWMFLLNVYTTSFVAIAKQLKCTSVPIELIDQSERLVHLYGSLKTGLGPLLLFVFSTNVLNLIASGYLLSLGINNFNIFMLADQLIVLVHVCSLCQECHEELRNNKEHLRTAGINSSGWEKLKLKSVLHQLLEETEFTMLGYCSVNKSTVVSIISTTLTYFFILFQMPISK